jgi:sigma-B regulation protein RsbU (phosphoserine phosphatase)
MNNGAFDFLTKPINLDDLETTILKTIDIISVIREGMESQSKLQDYYRDLDAAREIQQAILPNDFSILIGIRNSFDVFGKMEAALQVGGDFFDYFVIDENRLGFVIGDVSGKGVPSAIFMAVARTLIHSFGRSGLSPDECLLQTNNILCHESVDSMFVTVFYGILYVNTGYIVYSNAGHNHPYIIKNNGIVKTLSEGSSILLGAFEGAKFTSHTFNSETNDTLLLYTDGVNEAEDANDNQLGDPALMKHLQELQGQYKHPEQIVNSIFELVKNHTKGHSQSDDITVLAITYRGSSTSSNH